MHFQYGLNSDIYSTTKAYQIQFTIKHFKLSFHKCFYIPQFQYFSKAGQFVFSERSKMNEFKKYLELKYFMAYHCRKIPHIKFLSYNIMFLKVTKYSDQFIFSILVGFRVPKI